ncbi:MAG: hypothetical protein ACRDSJ_12360 [Rubrobacteraceae bacterium]
MRYKEDCESGDFEALPPATHLFVFPVPVEARMRVAYSYMQGIFLKHLYSTYKAIPLEVRQGWAEVVCEEESPLPGADELWAEFLGSGVAERTVAVSAQGWTSGSNIGQRQVDDAFLSESYLIGLAKAVVARPNNFQWQAGDQIPAFRREDLGDLSSRDFLMTREDPEATEFRAGNRNKEWNTLQIYGWLEEKAAETPEFAELVERTLGAMGGEASGVEISLAPAAGELERKFREEFVPRSSKVEWTGQAIPKIVQYLLLWSLVEKFRAPEEGKVVFMGWDLTDLRHVSSSFDTPELRGSLKFMDKNEPPKRGTELAARLSWHDKLESEIRLVPPGVESSASAPFELWESSGASPESLIFEAEEEVCTVCGKSGHLSEAGILPEGKKRHYDTPQASRPAKVCARCVQVWSLAPISTTDDDYAVVEVPVEDFLELFALYESLEGINRLETLKTLNKVSSLSVFPNKYLLMSRSSGKGKMPQVAQYYLQLARQPHFLEKLEESALEIIASMDAAKMSREVPLALSVFRRLPVHYATGSDEKVPAMAMINALERGRPYEALYVAADRAHEAGRPESQTISGGVEAYDARIEEFKGFFAGRQKGAVVRREIFRDVREFSDYLDGILRPIVREEVKSSGSSTSGVARKYTENITKSFIRGNTADFLYRVASFVEGRERQDSGNAWIKGSTRKKIYGDDPDDTEAESGAKLKLEKELERYYEGYSQNEREWKNFLEEVEARTLALILLNVRNAKRG